MQWKNTSTRYGAATKLFHWISAAIFIAAYIVVYYVIWFMDDSSPSSLPVLNVHWILGMLVGVLVVPRLVWRLTNTVVAEEAGSKLEHTLASAAHLGLYALMILMPITGYIGTHAPTDFGLFEVPSFPDTAVFHWFSATFGVSWEAFEPPVDAVHRFVGKWMAWPIVGMHIAAALYHHYVRRDQILLRMLPQRQDNAGQGQ